MDCKVCPPATGDMCLRLVGGGGRDGGAGAIGVGQIGVGFSHESEQDLAVMVSDFLENGSGGTESRCSSDSDSGFDLAQLADKISYCKLLVDQYERDMMAVVSSLLLSISKIDLQHVKLGTCNAGCIRYSLVKLLRISGYDAAVCASKWQGSGKVPGGDHEYIDVVNQTDSGASERVIIDIDFRSHFEIARAVESYHSVLNAVPVVFVGSGPKLQQYLQVMVQAANYSLKQNFMPLPPWRSLAYLEAKWQSPYQRQYNPDEQNNGFPFEHKQCFGHLKRLQTSLQSEIEVERMLKPIDNDSKRIKIERQWRSSLRAL